MFASAKGKQPKEVRQLQSSGTVCWSYPILPFGIVACTFFPTTFPEIAVCLYILYVLHLILSLNEMVTVKSSLKPSLRS